MKTSEIGKIGEDVACEYLERTNYKILARNVRPGGRGEIDIVAREHTGVLVFVEVKAGRSKDPEFRPELHYNKKKVLQMRNTCMMFTGKHPSWFSEKIGWRLDLITVILRTEQLTDYRKDCDINHYKNAVALS